jgi:hypothetical protein
MAGIRESSIVLIALCVAAPARAQTSPILTVDDYLYKAEITAGVSMEGPRDVNMRPDCERLGLPCGSGKEFPDFGLLLSVALYPTGVIGIVGELSTYRNGWYSYGKTCAYAGPPPCEVNEINHVTSTIAGLKVRSRLLTVPAAGPPAHERLFFQLLAGPQWSDVGPIRLAIQPGAGVDHYLRNGATFHFEMDYRFSPDRERDLSTIRFVVGLEIPVGSGTSNHRS